MQIKRFEAADMAEALRLIKREFGPEAVILSARSVKKEGGIFGSLKKRGVEVTAATDNRYIESEKTHLFRKLQKIGNSRTQLPAHKMSYEKKGIFGSIRGEIKGLRNRTRPPATKNPVEQTYSEDLSKLYGHMVQQGVKEDIASELLKDLSIRSSLNKNPRSQEIKHCLKRIFDEMHLKARPIKAENGKRKIVSFVGPTGVGKTTTIAKLAAIHALKMQNRVALLTVDNYRISAIEQLRVYAKIIGVPMEVASNRKELKNAVSKLENKDLVFIDTPGMSHRDESKIDELRRFLTGISNNEIHLLLSAVTKEKDLEEMLNGFKSFSIDKLIFTKIDETSTFGAILNQLLRTKIPLSYFTNGQQVPGDIQIATLDMLMKLITNKQMPSKTWHHPKANITEMESERYKSIHNTRVTTYYLANSNSDVFHGPNCKWAKKIKSENMILFETVKEAMRRNFKACKLCKPDINEVGYLFPGESPNKKTGSYG